jgi:VIT1/CCC1 family predicted Fe2+/Mn2+ transporter
MDNQILGRQLVMGELFDLSLYRLLRQQSSGDMAALLSELIVVEERHLDFWKRFFRVEDTKLSLGLRIRLLVFSGFARVFGDGGVSLILEAIEINGIRKYLTVWELYRDQELGQAVRQILDDELQHEDAIVSDTIKRQVHPERIRDIFLGLNDGLVEILGAVSGFYIAFQTIPTVLAAASTVAIAGAFSMAAGVFVAVGSEREAGAIERAKRRYLGENLEEETSSHPFGSAAIVGISYLFGAAIPLLPVFFGAKSIVLSLVCSGIVVTCISFFLAFLSGMEAKRRMATNLIILALAVGVTAFIGWGARQFLGIEI